MWSSGIAQSTFVGHLVAQPDRMYPTSHIIGHGGWNETFARELLLRDLTAFEGRLADEGFDVYRLGHKMNPGSYNETGYQDSLIADLQARGLVPRQDRGYAYVEPWRIRGRANLFQLQKIWRSRAGARRKWTSGWMGLRLRRNGVT